RPRAMPSRAVLRSRRPGAVAALPVSFTTPLPNSAWTVFPAVFGGNAAVLKPSEHTPASAAFFGELCAELLPAGVLNVVQGLGSEGGAPPLAPPALGLASVKGPPAAGRRATRRASSPHTPG